MQIVPLKALPTQRFNIGFDNNEWEIGVKLTNGTISCSFTLNGVVVITNTRAVGGRRIIPSVYEEAGNFAILTTAYEIPDYTKFGTTQNMVYISPAELVALRVPSPSRITAADFDPNGALPLRFAPQGYTLA